LLDKFNYFLQKHFCLDENVSEANANNIFNNVVHKVSKDTFSYAQWKSITMYYTQVLVQLMTNKIAQDLPLTKEYRQVDWLVKDLEVWDWFCEY
jgi:hypothetical protein